MSSSTSEVADEIQLAPVGDEGPDVGDLIQKFNQCLADSSSYADQCEQNYATRYALWDNQSSDGKKHARAGNGQAEVVPWEGASDLRVFLTDEAINAKVAMFCMAFRRASIVASPVEGNDLKRAKIVQGFVRWMIQTQIPEIDREVELLANYIWERGLGVTGQFWETKQEKTLVTLTLEQLQQQFGEEQNVVEMLHTEALADMLQAMFEEIFGCSARKAKKMLYELRSEEAKTTVPALGRKKSYPVMKAFCPGRDIFLPKSATDIETSPEIWRLHHFSAEKLRSLVLTDKWNAAWVEKAIETCRGKKITLHQNDMNGGLSRSMVTQTTAEDDLIAVVYGYRRLSDEDGVPGVYCTIFSPLLPEDDDQPGFAKHGLSDLPGEHPFVLYRSEYLSRDLYDSRGIPETGKPWQDQMKAHTDARIDAASISILPPLMYPQGRPPGRWGAGARVAERRPGEYHFADRVIPDMNTEASLASLKASFNQYHGFATAEGDPQFAALKNQFATDKFLSSTSKALRQVWKLYQLFGSDQVYFRVVGLKQVDPTEFNKGNPDEDFDFILSYRVDSMDPERTAEKLEQIAKIVATTDRDGAVNYSELLQVMIESIDPTIAERIIDPKEVGQARVVADMQDMLAKVFAGQDQDIKLGTPPQLGLQILQQYVQGDPIVQQRMQNKEDPFASRIEKLAKQFEMQSMQAENRKIGRYGA